MIGDKNGIIYWIGTQYGKSIANVFTNPHDLGLLTVKSSCVDTGKIQYFVYRINISNSVKRSTSIQYSFKYSNGIYKVKSN